MTLAGQVITGGVASVTVTENEQVLLRPVPSIARHVTFVLPCGKLPPLAGPLTRPTVTAPGQLSVAVGAG